MPATDLISPFVVSCAGGLTLNKDVFSMQPGEALILQNFEPDIKGGYRRVSGTALYNTTQIPQGSSNSSLVVDCSIIFNGQVIVARGGDIHRGTTSGSFTTLTTGLGTSTRAYDFEKFNFNGTDKLIIATGHSPAQIINTSFAVDVVNATGGGTAPSNPKFVKAFQNHMFYAGATNSQEVIFSVPFEEDNFTSASGAGSFKVDSTVVGMKVFRNELIIFCQDRIYKLTGTSSSNFAVQEVTRNIGCRDGGSIQEIGGDVIFLAPDGLRTIAGTARIGDVELGSISRQIQSRIDEVTLDRITSMVIRDKSQYRLFYTNTSLENSQQKGIIGTLRPDGFQWSETRGLEVTSIGSGFDSNNVEQYYHGDTNGFVYQHDIGNNFDGSNILARFETPNYDYGDLGTLKTLHYVRVSASSEGITEPNIQVRFDYGNTDIPQPPELFDLGVINPPSKFGDALFNTNVFGGGDNPLIRVPLQGSGTSNNFTIISDDTKPPYTINGFYVDYIPSGRR